MTDTARPLPTVWSDKPARDDWITQGVMGVVSEAMAVPLPSHDEPMRPDSPEIATETGKEEPFGGAGIFCRPDPVSKAGGAESPSRDPLDMNTSELIDEVERLRRLIPARKPLNDAGEVRLWRAIDALGGVADGSEFFRGYSSAIDAVLGLLERRGFTEFADPLDELVRLERVARHDREHAGKLEARVRVLEGDVDTANKRADEFGEMVDRAQSRTEKAIQIAQQRTEERDAAAENARKERDQHAATVASLDWVQEAFEGGEIQITAWGMQRGEVARAWIETLKAEVERLSRIDRNRPRCRVVTSPRFYGEEEREKAARAFHDDALGASDHSFDALRPFIDTTREWCFEVVDCVATALGMRRTEA